MIAHRLRRWLWAFAVAASLGLLQAPARVQAQAAAETRVAVVIGNAAYPTAPLVNTLGDAAAVAATLREAGFSVIELRDGTKAQMLQAVERAAALLRGRGGVGLFYFAGHGVQLDWHNYLVPVDAQLASAATLRDSGLNLQTVIDAFRMSGNRVSLVVLDACRDNPFVDGAGVKGLAQMDAPPGTMLAFATAPGRVAEDGNPIDGNGLYTHHLVREMRRPATKVEDVFKRVRVQVRKDSQGRQVPWESTSLEDDFYFDPTIRVTTLAEDERTRAVSADVARERAEWARIRRSTDPGDFVDFLIRQKSGEFADTAELRLQELRQLSARAKPGQPIRLPDPKNRYAFGDALTYQYIDGFTQLEREFTWRVTFADDERVEFSNGEVLTQAGATLRDARGFQYDPPRQNLAPGLAPGKAWHAEFKTWSDKAPAGSGRWDFKVAAIETLNVPAGSFETYRIETSGEATQGHLMTHKGTHWIDTQTLLPVRIDMVVRQAGRIEQFYSIRLTSRNRAPRWAEP
jgi:hypothetical protein